MALETAVTHIADLNKLWPVGSDPKSSMDEHLRNLKTALLNDFPGYAGTVAVTGTDGGAANAYTLTPSNALPGYSNRMIAVFAPTVANTGASTLNVSGLGAKSIVSVSGAALVSGDLAVGTIYLAAYDGTSFRLTSTTKNYADQLAFTSSLPAQAGNAGKYVTTDGTAASWASIVPPQVIRSARTANTILGVADSQKLIDITSGTFTQTFDAAATLGNGWFCWLRNNGTGDITLDPNGTETIDGLASYITYPGEARLVQCDGVTLTSTVISPFNKTFISSANFIKPPGYGYFGGQIWNGGNSGSKAISGQPGYAGGGGGAFPFEIPSSLFGASEAITIGAGGAGVTAVGTAGNIGGVSSIGTLLAMAASGTALNGSSFTGATSAGSGLIYGFEGQAGAQTMSAVRVPWGGSAGSSDSSTASGNTLFGGSAGGSVAADGTLRAPGTSKFGGNGGAASAAGNGAAGVAPGGGGGGTLTGASSGPGARGELRIWGIA